jgi:glycosyltransferase involved in cell wall biosynthesis
MNILVVTPGLPYPFTNGSALVLGRIVRHLRPKHRFILCTSIGADQEEKDLAPLKEFYDRILHVRRGRIKRGLSTYLANVVDWRSGHLLSKQNPKVAAEFIRNIDSALNDERIDLVYCHQLEAAEFARHIAGVPKVLNLIDSTSLALRRNLVASRVPSPFRFLEDGYWYLRISAYEKRIMDDFSAVITVGKKDYEELKRLSRTADIRLVPNGVDSEYFAFSPEIPRSAPVLFFSGNMNFPPNVDAAIYFARKIFPHIRRQLPRAEFLIVGANPIKAILELNALPGVAVEGYVPDIRSWIQGAVVAVCPIRYGSGIKNKMLEWMSVGRAIVSTSRGAEGIEAIHGQDMLLADEPRDFARCVIELAQNPTLRFQLTQNARALIERRYTWALSVEKYEQIFSEVVERWKHQPGPGILRQI